MDEKDFEDLLHRRGVLEHPRRILLLGEHQVHGEHDAEIGRGHLVVFGIGRNFFHQAHEPLEQRLVRLGQAENDGGHLHDLGLLVGRARCLDQPVVSLEGEERLRQLPDVELERRRDNVDVDFEVGVLSSVELSLNPFDVVVIPGNSENSVGVVLIENYFTLSEFDSLLFFLFLFLLTPRHRLHFFPNSRSKFLRLAGWDSPLFLS